MNMQNTTTPESARNAFNNHEYAAEICATPPIRYLAIPMVASAAYFAALFNLPALDPREPLDRRTR
jgi:hypothetical protein